MDWFYASTEINGARRECRIHAESVARAKKTASTALCPFVGERAKEAPPIFLWSAVNEGRMPVTLLAVRVSGKWRQPPAEGGSGSEGASGAAGGSSGAGGSSAASGGASSGTS